MERLEIVTLAAQNISSPLLVYTHTATAYRSLVLPVYLTGVAGDGVYKACYTKQLAGAGSFHQSETTVLSAALGVTTCLLPALRLPCTPTDVVRLYVEGLAGDVSVGVVIEAFDESAGGGGGLTAQETRDAMLLAPTAGAPAAGSVDKHLDDILVSVAGTGLLSYTDTVTDPLSNPLDGVYVWLSTDEAGANPVGDAYTNSFGVFIIAGLDAGTYWRHIQYAGFRAAPAQVVVA